jgi:hypothetical protein
MRQPDPMWCVETRLTMPMLNGWIMDPHYAPEQFAREYTERWREWMRKNAGKVWPTFCGKLAKDDPTLTAKSETSAQPLEPRLPPEPRTLAKPSWRLTANCSNSWMRFDERLEQRSDWNG